jgi:hypothetical protein
VLSASPPLCPGRHGRRRALLATLAAPFSTLGVAPRRPDRIGTSRTAWILVAGEEAPPLAGWSSELGLEPAWSWLFCWLGCHGPKVEKERSWAEKRREGVGPVGRKKSFSFSKTNLNVVSLLFHNYCLQNAKFMKLIV